MPHGSEDVLRALEDVRWSPDKEMSNHVVQKSLTIWNKFAENKDIERAINTAHQIWGRRSLFEDWIANVRIPLTEIDWVMETFIEVRLFKGKGDFSNQEMQKHSPINVFWLRRLSVVGLLEKYVVKGIEVCEAAECRTTEMPGIVQALKRCQSLFKMGFTFTGKKKLGTRKMLLAVSGAKRCHLGVRLS